jgi:hypothetical protein
VSTECLGRKKGNSLEQYENIQSNDAHFNFELIFVPDFVENRPGGTYEKARLRFAHAETVVPFSCLLGLFLEGSGIFSLLHLLVYEILSVNDVETTSC